MNNKCTLKKKFWGYQLTDSNHFESSIKSQKLFDLETDEGVGSVKKQKTVFSRNIYVSINKFLLSIEGVIEP